jgi:uncharacterized membrane protein
VGVTVEEPGNVTGPFWEWIDIKDLTQSGSISDTWYPTDGWWWWRASRLIHDKGLTGNDMEVIDEFPAFSFLLGDMHPHVLAYPFVFLVIGLAFNLLLAGFSGMDAPPASTLPVYRSSNEDTTPGEWWIIYLCLGAIGFLNTWDMPFYFFLLVATHALNGYLRQDKIDETPSNTLIEHALGKRAHAGQVVKVAWLRRSIYRAIELALASVLLYLPYWLYSRPQAGAGILPNLFNVSRMAHLFLMFGTFFVVLVALLIVLFVELHRAGQLGGRSLLRQGLPIWLGTILFFPALMALILLPVVLSPSIRTYIDDMLASPEVQQFLGPQTLGSLLQVALRIRTGLLPPQLRAIQMPSGPWSFLFVSLLIAAILFWFVRTVGDRRVSLTAARSTTVPERPAKAPPHALNRAASHPTAKAGSGGSGVPTETVTPSAYLALLLAFVGLMLIFSVEFVYLRDAFGTRMNTVFKFYFQAWALLGLVAAFGVYYVTERRTAAERPVAGRGKGNRIARLAFAALFALLVSAGLLYPLGASLSRTGGFAGSPTLDGVRFVARERPEEHAAVRWLNENAVGERSEVPVIVEAVRGSFAYEYARISSRTGLPAVMGWTGHEGQWHGLYEEIAQRERDVNLLYSGSAQDTKRIMEQYDVTYVIVGYLERAEYPNAPFKFERIMDVVFREGGTTIFRQRGK